MYVSLCVVCMCLRGCAMRLMCCVCVLCLVLAFVFSASCAVVLFYVMCCIV